MKKIIVLLFTIAIAYCTKSQTLITYGNNSISKEDFLKAYNKNKTTEGNKEQQLREYVTLYTNFKLKVKAAIEMGLDTSAQLKEDVLNFRRQIEENYLKDEASFNALYNEAFQRIQEDRHVLHFSIMVDSNTSPKDSVQAIKNINAAFQNLSTGNINYDSIAAVCHVKFSDFGFVTAFSLPYQYENIVYGLSVGETSKPYRSKKAWHLFKVVDQRKSIGKWKIAQILFSFPPNADNKTKQSIQKKADSVYRLLKQGAEFSSLARDYSDDKLTYLNKGEVPEFSTGKFQYSFEKEVFKLTTDGEVSMPFQTDFGIHIVKRISVTPTSTNKTDDALQFELKQQLSQDERINISKEKFARDVKIQTGFRVVATIKESDLFSCADSVKQHPAEDYDYSKLPISNKTIIAFKKEKVTGKEWLEFVRDYTSNSETNKEETSAVLWEKYKSAAALNYYRKHLTETNADFRYQIQEFKEGNMLFEIMEKKVWSQAAIDSVGLRKYFDDHRQQYKWLSSADVLLMTCSSEKLAQETIQNLKSGINWRTLIETKQSELQADSGRFELAQLNSIDNPTPGQFSLITKNEDGTVSFMRYNTIYSAGELRDFENSRGAVINEYQTIVENKWLNELRKKYPVKINESVFQSIIK